MKIPEIEISVKFKGALKSELKKINKSQDAADVLRLLFDPGKIEWTEEFIMVCLGQSNKVIGYYKVSSGGMTVAIADTRVICTVALQTCAVNVIVAHNHPSGNTTPSKADEAVTDRLKKALALLEIRLLDHVIITPDSYYSFADNGEI